MSNLIDILTGLPLQPVIATEIFEAVMPFIDGIFASMFHELDLTDEERTSLTDIHIKTRVGITSLAQSMETLCELIDRIRFTPSQKRMDCIKALNANINQVVYALCLLEQKNIKQTYVESKNDSPV